MISSESGLTQYGMAYQGHVDNILITRKKTYVEDTLITKGDLETDLKDKIKEISKSYKIIIISFV
jgi:hypothetical protein